MKKNTKIIYISELILAFYVILLALFINKLSYDTRNLSAIIILLLESVALLTFFGYKKDKNYLKGSAIRIVITASLTFMLVIYTLGIILGFTRGYVYHSIYELMINIAPIVIVNLEIELLRYTIVKNSYNNKIILVLFALLSIGILTLLEINAATLMSAEDKFIFLSTIIIPIIAEEALCTYITYKISPVPSIIYKLVTRAYIYLFPIVPNLGNYLYAVVNIVFPFIIYNILNKIIIRYEKEKQQLAKVNRIVFTVPLAVLLVALILLITGIFKYKIVAIASNSMSPTYRRGDAIIYEKIDVKRLEIGDILVFRKNNIIVTHRIVEILKKNGKYYFITKGDNNNTVDDLKTPEENVLGKVNSAYKYIGYPTILMNELLGKE